MNWIGPYKIQEFLAGMADKSLPAPPAKDGVYLVSERQWTNEPTKDCVPLYVGGNTGRSPRFRTRMGDLIADMLGFFCDETGHHTGGQSLRKHCLKNELNPLNLWIGWAEGVACGRCAEIEVVDKLNPTLNKKTPPACKQHK